MRTLEIDPYTQDLVFDGQNSFRLVEGIAEAKQSIRMLLSTNQGEWFLNLLHGLDFYEILGQVPGPETELLARAAVMEALEQESRIEEVLDLEVSFDIQDRNAKIDFWVRMEGQEVEGEVTA